MTGTDSSGIYPGTARVTITDSGDRADAGAFVARAVRMDPEVVVRMRNMALASRIQLWATTPFDAMVTRSVGGLVEPSDVTVRGSNLLPALSISRADQVDPGPVVDGLWRSQLPPLTGWVAVDQIPGSVIVELTEAGNIAAKDSISPAGGTSSSLLDSEVLTVSGEGMKVIIPMRCLFALSGMGFAGVGTDAVTVYATDSWLRLDSTYGAVVRRRHSLLPLLF
ncbi:hypothetical protein EH165_09330 [Nakamurella antarctica]|uniref:Uncharacterized protein n=1 Tax=Nakamurella antarctica TaxID=1902245 RepID=A0A3G8ZM51_9ACTN|nr:hypothetical protein [Nakamurella antarctica]AZI58310.1 hypothetical protein EH165_09330 [Nakamurella antarctica]